jgi:crotonobetainyl-CoA:carnitine CoA-transferase CaiB-like acyl-CoA transferase
MSMTTHERLRVVDLSMGWAGPLVGAMLSEMGAEVIKIEDTRHFDWWRGSLSMGAPEEHPIERSAVFNSVNRGKLGVTLNLADPRGVEVLKRLAVTADVLIENYSVGVMERLGLSYRVLSALNPRLVMISMPSFGAEDPESDARGYGNTVEAMAGVTGLTGYHDGGQPYTLSNALGDPVGGINGMFAVMVALHERERTGRGQWIELAQVEAAIPLMAEALLDYQLTGKIPPPHGNRHPRHAPHGIYRCAGEDNWIAVGVESEAQWRALLGVLGLERLAADPRFATAEARKRNEDALDDALSHAFASRETEEVARRLIRAGVPAGQVNSAPAVMADEQLQARGYFVPVERAIVGTHLYPGAVARFSQTPLETDRPAPLLGEHNRVVLREVLGMSDAEMEALESAGIIGTRPLG